MRAGAVGATCAALAALAVAAGPSYATVPNLAVGWGENEAGQLGSDAFNGTDVPVQVEGASGVVAVSAGGRYSLALLSNGTVAAWGADSTGELGLGKLTKEVPTPTVIPGLKEVVQVAAGHKFSLALLKNGTVWAWGQNQYDKLGLPESVELSSTPLQVKGLSGVKAISAGYFHALALLSNGTVMAWGNGDYGELGNGGTSNSATPVQVSGLSNVVAIGAGGIDSIALLANGTVESWGGNEYGQLGHGLRVSRRTALPEPVIGLGEVTQISAGTFYNLALLKNGSVMAWGYDHSGQLGNDSANKEINGMPQQVIGLSEVTSVSASVGSVNVPRTNQHSLALLKSGKVVSWGGNEFGQLGTGSTETALTPEPVAGLESVTAISAGGFHSLAVN